MSVVLITGGTGAIGSALLEEFSKTDDVVFTYNKNAKKAAELSEQFNCRAIQADVSDMNTV